MADAPERIALVLRHRENARLLAEYLGPRYQVVDAPDGGIPDAPFDLCIIDGASLEALEAAVHARKAAEAPGFVPFLLVTARRDLRIVNRYLYKAIDELIFMPIEKVELQARIELLLRARRASEAMKRQGEDFFTALVTLASTGVYLGWDGHFLYMNEAGAGMLGYAPGEIVGRLGPLDLAHPADHEAVAKHMGDLEKGRTDAAHYTFRGRRKDGTWVPLETYERRVMFQGRPARLGTLMDVSERAALEADRERLHEERLEDLRRNDLMKDQFLSILSHELRTPLNAIQGFGSILEDEIAGPLSDQQHGYVRKILAGSDVLLALVNDLLDMSRIQAGKFSLATAPMDPRAAIAMVVDGLAPLAAQKHQDLSVTMPPALPPIVADEQRFGQILMNLVGNAIKFTPDDGHVRVHARVERGRELLVEVEDDGPGIAPADVAKLFERFTQLDMTRTRRAGGTGLGLSIAKALVEAHGGQLGVRTAPGRGSTFWFSLPIGG